LNKDPSPFLLYLFFRWYIVSHPLQAGLDCNPTYAFHVAEVINIHYHTHFIFVVQTRSHFLPCLVLNHSPPNLCLCVATIIVSHCAKQGIFLNSKLFENITIYIFTRHNFCLMSMFMFYKYFT
jgi:hypothetical protein